MRCGGRIISSGSSIYKVLKECGEPSYRYARQEEEIKKRYGILKKNSISDNSGAVSRNVPEENDINEDNEERYLIERKRENINIDEWTYNFGPTRLIHTLIFRNNRLESIKTGGYGYTGDYLAGKRKCSASIGDLKAEVLMKCGEPVHRSRRSEEKTRVKYLYPEKLTVDEYRVFIDIDEWTYNIDVSHFVQILIFKNNRLVSLETGEYGD